MDFDAVLVLSFGGPEGPEQVRPFLEHVTRGRNVPPERLDDVAQRSAEVCAAALRTTLEHNWLEHLTHSVTEEAALESAATRAAPNPSDPFTRAQVHVAAGMIAVQLWVSTHEALDRLRAYAFAQNRSTVAVAADVVTRRLSFSELDDNEPSAES